MEYRRLGKSGLKVSEVSLGSWVTFSKQVDHAEAMALMSLAYDEGINFFDNAEGYEAGESETLMGAALKDLGWSRDSFVVSSKVFWGGSKPTQKGLRAASMSPRPATQRSSACSWIIWICISATDPTSTRPLRRRCGRCTIW